MKKVYIIIIIILLLALAGLAVYYFSNFRTTPSIEDVVETNPSFPRESSGTFTLPGTKSSLGGGDNNQDAGSDTVGSNETGGDNDVTDLDVELSSKEVNLKRIADVPIISMTTYGTKENLSLKVRYAERGTSHIYEYNHTDESTKRISNTTLPAVQDATWGNFGQSIILRFEDSFLGPVKSFLGRINEEEGELIDNLFLNDNITSIVSAPRGNERLSCSDYITSNISQDGNNDSDEVTKLQRFLKDDAGFTNLNISGVYDEESFNTMLTFQERFSEEILDPVGLTSASGIVGPSTRRQINKIYCNLHGGFVTGGDFFYLTKNANGSRGYIRDFDKDESTEIFRSNLSEWEVDWPEEDTLALYTKPASDVHGYLYLLDISNGKTKEDKQLNKVVGPLLGLSALVSGDARYIVYTEASQFGQDSYIYDNNDESVRNLAIGALPHDKCVWSNDNTLFCAAPSNITSIRGAQDAWYKGLINFQDDLFEIDVETDTITLIDLANNSFDMTNMLLSDDASHLYFTNKEDYSLWAIEL